MNQYELVQHCIDTEEFITIKIYDRYVLFHRNIIKYSDNYQLDLSGKNSEYQIVNDIKYLVYCP